MAGIQDSMLPGFIKVMYHNEKLLIRSTSIVTVKDSSEKLRELVFLF